MSDHQKHNRFRAMIATLVVLAFGFLGTASARAQVAGVTISGTISDPSGAAIPTAQISIKNVATGVIRVVTTDSSGLYVAPNLLPGSYEITFSATGFSTLVETNITVAVGEQRSLDAGLKVGQSSQQIQVTAAEAIIQTTSSTLSAEVDPVMMRELPLNGRDWTQLATLQPGVLDIRTQAGSSGVSSRGNRGFGNQLSANGHRPNENNYRVNGISINDYTNGSPGSALGVQLGVDAIQEFSVLTGNYSAEYGRTSGGVINALTKPGTDDFHGSAYWFLRDAKLDARNYFDPPQIPPFHRNQFGGSGGGPIKKGKTFIFGDYEGVRQDKSLSFHDTVPTAAARAGNLCSAPTTGTCTPTTITIDPLVAPYLGFYPLPNAGLTTSGNGDTGFFNGSGLANLAEDYVTARVDHTFSDKDNLAASWFFDNSHLSQPDALLVGIHEVTSRRQMFGLEESHIFSATFLNTVRFGYSRTQGVVNEPVKAINPLGDDPSLGAIPGKNAPDLTVPGLTQMAGALGSPAFSTHTQNSFQGYDDAFLTRGNHSIRFGAAIEDIQYNVVHESGPTGTFKFPSLKGFLLNEPTSVSALIPGSSKELGARQTLFGLYVQDDWRIRSNLTLNLGLRYEPTTLPTEAHGQYGVIEDLFSGPATVPVPTLWKRNQTLLNFEPRVGFAWDPFRNGKTAVRGGFGIYDVLPLPWQYAFNAASSFPFGEKGTAGNLPQGSFPTEAVQMIAFNPKKFQSFFIDQHPARNYAMNWNFNIQRELSSTTTATIGYVGSRTLHQPFTTSDANIVVPTQTSAGFLWPCDQTVPGFPVTPCTGGGTLLNTSVGAIEATFYDNTASYNALQAQILKKLSRGFQIQGSYTWSKCLDSGSSGSVADPFVTSLTSLLWLDPQARRGLCDFNQTQNFVANWVWQLPTPKFGGEIGKYLLGGWEADGIITATTGSPTTLVIAGDPLGENSSDTYNVPDRVRGPGCNGNPVTSNPSNFIKLNCFTVPMAPASFASMCQPGFTGQTDSMGNPITIPGSCLNLFGNSGRNSVIGPGLFDFDFSIFKNIPVPRISETFNIQFRAEFFDVLNHPNFQVPNFADGNDVIFNQNGTPIGGAGAIDATATDPRQIQFGLKVTW
jgi:hypothetical protein